ncbi:hypothetical protein LJC55_03405 [Eubacteriales bacterium OttesenSCG-928-N14]|nr:hypothetical protein [Eubacteriales bacterium OttesenSCG-928-N14]
MITTTSIAPYYGAQLKVSTAKNQPRQSFAASLEEQYRKHAQPSSARDALIEHYGMQGMNEEQMRDHLFGLYYESDMTYDDFNELSYALAELGLVEPHVLEEMLRSISREMATHIGEAPEDEQQHSQETQKIANDHYAAKALQARW